MNIFRHSWPTILRNSVLLQEQTRTSARRVFRPKVKAVTFSDKDEPEIDPLNPIYGDYEDLIFSPEKAQHKGNKFVRTSKSRIVKEKRTDIPEYVQSPKEDMEFARMLTNLSIKSKRESMNKILLEGTRLINDAIESQTSIHYIYFTKEEQLAEIAGLKAAIQNYGTKIIKVMFRDMKKFSALMTSPGCMAVAEKPSFESIVDKYQPIVPLTIICDNIRDPGNVGTIIRSSAAASIANFISVTGSCDVWNSKTIKSGCGSHFRFPLMDRVAWHSLTEHLPALEDTEFFITDPDCDSKDVSFFDLDAFADHRPKNKVLIVSNEAFGTSPECEAFVQKLDPSKVHRVAIPLGSGVESLNSAIAASIFLFEFRRQFYKKNR